MESLLQSWDGESLVVRYDRPSGAWIGIAIHSTRLGPATGGTRMKSYPDLRSALKDALGLAANMTLKFALTGLSIGGGKAVIAVPPALAPAERTELLHRYGALLYQLGGLFRTGPDLGTSSADMDLIAETGAPYVFGRTTAAGGAGDSAPATALGVYTGMQLICERLFGNSALAGRRVLVQGAGHIGARLLEQLLDAGAEVLFSDVSELAVQGVRVRFGLQFIPPEQVYDTPCDIFAPCALGGVLSRETIPRLKCQAVAGAANNQLATPEDAELLRGRGILYAPDFVLNLGGALAITGMESMGWSAEQARDRVIGAIRQTLGQALSRAEDEGLSTDAAARCIAQERLDASALVR